MSDPKSGLEAELTQAKKNLAIPSTPVTFTGPEPRVTVDITWNEDGDV